MQDLIDKSAAAVGMTDFLDAEPTHLSGGQKQRVAIAGILAMAPEIIIFDESTSMLDPQGKASINQEINHLHQSRDITILSITHDMEEVAQSEHVIVLNQGKIEMEGTPKKYLRIRFVEKYAVGYSFCVKVFQISSIQRHIARRYFDIR
jgi:energy-coupling factor transport system ATP-binding protein